MRNVIARRPIAAFLIYGIGMYFAVVFAVPDTTLTGLELRLDGILGGLLGVGVAAFVVTAAVDGRRGVADLVSRTLRWRVPPRWYAITLFGVPVAAVVVAFAIYGTEAFETPPEGWAHVVGAVVALFVAQFFFFQLAEEVGWTGFFQHRLRDRYTPVRLSAVVAFWWALWHLPDFIAEEPWSLELVVTVPIFFAVELAILFFARAVIVWIYEHTGCSVLLVIVFHASFDATISRLSEELIPASNAVRFLLLNAIVIVPGIAAIVAWRRAARRETAPPPAPVVQA